MFYDAIKNIDWDETKARILAKKDADVIRALNALHPTVDDFMALISPAADKFIEPMARLEPQADARALRQDHQYVHTYLYHQLVHQLLRLLRIPCAEQDEAHHPH